jgi:hypothetical protein
MRGAIDVPVGPILHTGKLGFLTPIQTAVGPHHGLSGADARLLIF